MSAIASRSFRPGSVHRAMETDRAYRERLFHSGKLSGELVWQASNYHGYALDQLGDAVGVQRRIVEVTS